MTEIGQLRDALAEIMVPGFIDQWLDSSNAEFGGAKPIEIVERGEIDRIYELIYRLRSGQLDCADMTENKDDIRERIPEATPPSHVLREWAERPENQPPQSWYDDETDPFQAED